MGQGCPGDDESLEVRQQTAEQCSDQLLVDGIRRVFTGRHIVTIFPPTRCEFGRNNLLAYDG
jgi:hypothetical protein